LLPQRRRRSSTTLPIASIVIADGYDLLDEIRFNLLIIWEFTWMWMEPTK
jgi:hypothetical protein